MRWSPDLFCLTDATSNDWARQNVAAAIIAAQAATVFTVLMTNPSY
jgi:hypothetical protein